MLVMRVTLFVVQHTGGCGEAILAKTLALSHSEVKKNAFLHTNLDDAVYLIIYSVVPTLQWTEYIPHHITKCATRYETNPFHGHAKSPPLE